MKNYLIYSLIAAFTCLIACGNQDSKGQATNEHESTTFDVPDYPAYEAVVEGFFDKYYEELPYGQDLRFEKRPDGWYVCIVDYTNDYEVIKDELFWDVKKEAYLDVNFAASKLPALEKEQQVERHNNKHDKKYYRIYPYYGYPGWDWDVIKLLKDAKNLPDSTLYALGRAYSSYAGNLLNNNSGFASKEHQFDLPTGDNCMTSKQLNTYRKYRHLAIETFKKVVDMNPDYQTIVGPIHIKYANEHMTAYLDLLTYQNEEEAKKELTEGLYDHCYLNFAKNMLLSCDSAAILFTYGDNDTYPLLYVQAQYAFKPDILVVNESLLNAPRYANRYRNRVLDAPGIPLSFSQKALSDEQNSIVILKEEQDAMPLSDAIKSVKEKEHIYKADKSNYLYIPTKTFQLPQKEQAISWKIPFNYLNLSQLIILDILATNNWNRPVYFAGSVAEEGLVGLENHIRLEGLIYRLMPQEKITTRRGFVETDLLASNLLIAYKWNNCKNISKGFGANYSVAFGRLAEAYIEKDQTDSAVFVIDRCLKLFPNDMLPYDLYKLTFVQVYYQAKAYDKGNQLAQQILENIDQGIAFDTDMPKEQKDRYKIYAIQTIKQTAEEHEQQSIVNQCNEMMGKY